MSTSITQLSWAAGFLEGEGYFSSRKARKRLMPIIAAGQVQREPLDKLKTILGGTVSGPYYPKNPKHSSFYQWNLADNRAAGAMFTLYSMLSAKRQQSILEAIKHWTHYFYHGPKLNSDCHQNKPHFAKGLCQSCYMKQWKETRK